MRYLPQTQGDIDAMLKAVGVNEIDELFAQIPGACRRDQEMDLPPPMTEWTLDRHMDELAAQTATGPEVQNFCGAGSYEHFIPQTTSYLLGRSEFTTAYTPYQPELSQGTLQAIYEYQTLASRLLGLDVANASLYDGATALAEALLMAVRLTRRNTVALSEAIHPLYRKVVSTYLMPAGIEMRILPFNSDGLTELKALEGMTDLAAVAVQSPNFFGCIEDLSAFGDMIHAQKGLLVAGFTEALAFGAIKAPGEQGVDIACGEGQSLGLPNSYGGPGLGMMACKQKLMRNLPGRLVGMTKDVDGRRGFVLTLATREQHIRREKATSNICTNNSLCALSALMYMAAAGGTGFAKMAQLNLSKATYLKNALVSAGFEIPFSAPTFNEFVVRLPTGFKIKHKALAGEKGIICGIPLAQYYPAPHYQNLENDYLFCVTETKSKQDLDNLVAEVAS
ncbi:aminomethyl-transferring glycine dehydrogenase subunit GcvPA [Desulfobacterales bacterium HSG17]|nr:aminomethyl-transferring glycine dehydrogenase subunit GcvPA [Desulfobacterales bacterium HSG17]